MDTAAWYQAAHPAPAVCLGLTLRPYTLGHEILLHREHSAFTPRTATVSSEDQSQQPSLFGELALACLICSQSYADACSFLRSSWQPRIFTRLWRLRFFLKSPDLDKELKTFIAYRAAANWMPDENTPLHGRKFAAPWTFRYLTFLMGDLHLSEEQALEYPLSKATVLYAARQESLGKMELFNEQDEALFAARDAMDAAALAVTPEEEAAALAELKAMQGAE